MSLTITREQFEAAERAWRRATGGTGLAEAFAAAGITIAPPEPPEAMVRLADSLAAGASHRRGAALAALQHAAKVVRDAPYVAQPAGVMADRSHILRQLGAIA